MTQIALFCISSKKKKKKIPDPLPLSRIMACTLLNLSYGNTHDYIRMEITVLYLKIHGINCRFNGVIFTVSISVFAVSSPILILLSRMNHVCEISGF